MAAGKINLQKASGGITVITGVDGTGNTELVLPESGELATKEYADLKVALSNFTGTNQSLSVGGYQKLPGGLIIQWGVVNVSTSAVVNLPISYPNQQLFNIAGDRSSATPTRYFGTDAGSKTQFTVLVSNSENKTATWLSIGY